MSEEIAKNDALALIAQATESGASVETLERLFALREKMMTEQAEAALREALSDFQGRCPIIKKTHEVKNRDGSVRYRYAPLDEIVKVAQPILKECGLSVSVDTESTDTSLTAIVTVKHVLGASQTSRFTVPVGASEYMSDAQRWASALTYAKRYAYCNALGILTGDEDDDNMVAVPKESPKESPKKPERLQDSPSYKRLMELPQPVKDKMKKLGLNARQAIELCEKAGWEEKKILKEIALREVV